MNQIDKTVTDTLEFEEADESLQSRSSVQDRVYEELKRAFMTGRVVRGQKLPVRPLAAMLGTSSMPVREAIRRLAELRCVIMLPNGSAAVPKMTRTEFEHICALRLLNEGYCAEAAARQASAEDLPMIEKALSAVVSADREKDFDAYVEANYRFHFAVYRTAGSDIALRFVEGLWLRSGTFIHATRPLFEIDSDDWHTPLFEAICQRNPARARRAIEADLGDTFDWLAANAQFDLSSEVARPAIQLSPVIAAS